MDMFTVALLVLLIAIIVGGVYVNTHRDDQ